MTSTFSSAIILINRTTTLKTITPLVQSVRYRKPRWLPKAKSKEFYVREPTPIDPEEHAELLQRYTHYRASMRGLRLYLKEHQAHKEVQTVETQATDTEADFAWMTEEANKWNQFLAQNREPRQAEEERQEKERIEQLAQAAAEERLLKALEAEKQLQATKEAAANFIAKDQLEEAIEKMLDSRSDYNFAITKSGDILPGEYPDQPPMPKTDSSSTNS